MGGYSGWFQLLFVPIWMTTTSGSRPVISPLSSLQSRWWVLSPP